PMAPGGWPRTRGTNPDPRPGRRPPVNNNVVSMPIADLVEDMELYPRHAIDNSHVLALVLAEESGATLPPVIADRKSKKVVDGWHRLRARKRRDGAAAVIDVELRDYKDEASMVLDAVSLNSAHGRKLDAIDQTRAALMLEKQKVTTVKIAIALHVPEKRVKVLVARVARAEHQSAGTVPGTRKITLKRPVAHLK